MRTSSLPPALKTNSCSTMVISFLTSNLHLLTALNAYLSTPKFVTILTDLSLELIYQTDRDDFLMTELKKINKRLPAAVYIPFVNDSVRNYAILHIVADEAKIFQTKERAPVLLHFEAFRPEELMLSVSPEKPLGAGAKTKKKGKVFRSTAELEYENYRSSSWDSSQFTKKDLERLTDPMLMKRGKDDSMRNPYQPERTKKTDRQSIKAIKQKEDREVEALT